MLNILAIIDDVLSILPTAVAAGKDIAGMISDLRNAIASSSDPTDAQWQAVDAKRRDLLSQLNTDPPALSGAEGPSTA